MVPANLERDNNKCMDNLNMVMACRNPLMISTLHLQPLLADLEEKLVYDQVLGPITLGLDLLSQHNKANSTQLLVGSVTCKTCLVDPQVVSLAKHSNSANLPINKALAMIH